jgi:uncharacterized protein (TIGR04255 family)
MPRYNSNFLEKVILKLDFDNISLAKLEEYIDAIRDTFDINNTQSGFEGSFNIDVVQGVVEQSKQELNIKEFTSTTKPDKKITLSQKWISLEYSNRSYSNSEELIEDVDSFIQPFIELLEVKLINRVGLRYINEIVAPRNTNPLAWGNYIEAGLIGSLAFANRMDGSLSRNFTQQYYKYAAADVLFSFGVWNDDFPNPVVAKKFILDFDCSSTIPRETSDVTLRTEIGEYNQIVESMFETAIKQPLRDLMGVQT